MTSTMNAVPEVGDIFYRSWGYDQTNVDFYQLVSLSASGKTGKAMKLAKQVVSGEGGSYTTVVALPGQFAENQRCARCSNSHEGEPGWDGHKFSTTYTYRAATDAVTVNHYGDHAWRWDGHPVYETGFGFGH